MTENTDRESLRQQLEAIAPGQLRFSRHYQMLYATDASNYQVEPIGVAVPNDVHSMHRLVEYCGRHDVPLLPRGGGTSLAGQCVNRAVVIDHSAWCRRVIELDASHRICHVEPGVTVDELNRWLDERQCGLFFAPDPATSAQATIGGCIGNNAAGARSIRYGRTVENLAGLDVCLSTGERLWLEPGAGARDPAVRRLARGVAEVVRGHQDEIRRRWPKTFRRNAGYALDLILSQLDQGIAPDDLNLSPLICGSEGTLAVILGAKLKLWPLPRAKGLAIASFASVEEAINATVDILRTVPVAVELLDDVVLEAARGNAHCRRYMEVLPLLDGCPPTAVLYVEYHEPESLDQVKGKFELLRKVIPSAAVAGYVGPEPLARAWALRKAGEPLLHGLSAHRKPLTFIEDNAVPIENLARFVKELKRIAARHGTKAAYYAHASVGVLHVRPMIDLHDAADRERMHAMAVETAELARSLGGVMSAEHGDGRVRGPLLESFYGPQIMEAFRQVKRLFDPSGVLNPGMIVDVGPTRGIIENLRVLPRGRQLHWPDVQTYFDYSDQEGFAGAVEMCNGAGVCRRTAVGTMCPSYRATMDERHSTRGRANALRLAITGQLPLHGAGERAAWDDRETIETLRLCLSCKACKSECPSNVDVARLKAEYTAQCYRIEGHVPLQARVFGHIRLLNRLGSILPEVSNWLASVLPVRAAINELFHIAPQRSLPRLDHSLYRWFRQRHRPKFDARRPKVVLFADCFTTFNEPGIGRAAVAVLELLGYQVLLPKVGCCGRSMISVGLLEDAIRTIDSTFSQLLPYIQDPDVVAIIVCEPSCLASFKDDWLQLRVKADKALRRELADKAMLAEEFVERFWDRHPTRPTVPVAPGGQVLLHGHCHQKSLWGDQTSSALLRRLVGARLTVLGTGCCGMAGAFGFTRDRYDLSMKVGEMSLLPAVRQAGEDAVIVAPGTSCRHQIRDGAGRRALHPIELAAEIMMR